MAPPNIAFHVLLLCACLLHVWVGGGEVVVIMFPIFGADFMIIGFFSVVLAAMEVFVVVSFLALEYTPRRLFLWRPSLHLVMAMEFRKVEGARRGHAVRVYALSTCGWCRKLKDFLGSHGVAYEYVDVDLCTRDEKREVTMFLKEHGLPLMFPLTVVDGSTFVSGYRPDELSRALGLLLDG